MLRFIVFAVIATAAASPQAYQPAVRSVSTPCASAIVASSSSAQVGTNTVLLEVLTCSPGTTTDGPVARSKISIGPTLGEIICDFFPIFCPPKPYKPKPPVTTTSTTTAAHSTTSFSSTATPTATTSSASPTPTPTPATNVCGSICDVSCSDLDGVLPPISDDCQTIKDSIQIFAGNTAPTFVVQPLHIQQLTFGTCRYFFENLGAQALEYCWSDLSDQGSVSASTCFPPTQPANSLAVCEALDTTWEVGVSHS